MSRKPYRVFVLLTVSAIVITAMPAGSGAAPAEGVAPLNGHVPLNEQEHTYAAPEEGTSYVAGELIVRFAPEVGQRLAVQSDATGKVDATGVSALDALGAKYRLRAVQPVFRRRVSERADAARAHLPPAASLGDVYRLTFPIEVDVELLVADYSANPDVVYAEPNYVFEFDDTIPNDPYFGQQWHLHNTGQYHLVDADIDAPEAWDIVTGTDTIVIAVIDTGIDRDHPDLDEHIWTNPGETPGNSIDDDGNGYADDTWGWNWVSDVSDPDDYDFDDPCDDNGHGTHVAGIAAAETDNGTGVAGVCWNCKVMSLKAFESNGVGTTSDIVQAIDYATDKGADVINMSFGSYAESLLLEDTLADAYGQAVLVAAAGNYGLTPKATVPYYPASYSFVLGVGATNVGCANPPTCTIIDEFRADFSNHGVNADVGAPGVSIYSTFPDSDYASMAGTSMATPIVSGQAGLLLSQNPGWSKEMVRGQILQTTEPIYTSEFERVNVYQSVSVSPTPDLRLVEDGVVYGDGAGDGDGLPDAGETFTVTVPLKNYWSEALTTTAVISTSDPYVTLINDTASYGNISAYATMHNTVTPYQMTLTTTAPNNHKIEFTMTITANAGAYTTAPTFSLLVQRGIEIPDPLFPAVITQSMTLEDDYLYIVKQNMLVSRGVTLTIEPGTRLQFDPDKFIKVEGTLVASGTADLPIVMTSNSPDPQPGDFQGVVFSDSAVDGRPADTTKITTLVASGDATPLGGQFITFTTPAVMNPVGDVVFGAALSGTTASEGLFTWMKGHLLTIVAGGETAPGASGATFTNFRQAQLDKAGTVAFIADLSDGAQGVFTTCAGVSDDLIVTGDTVLSGTTPITLATFTDVTMNAKGTIAFRATYWLTSSLVTHPGIFVYRPDLGKIYAIVDTFYPFEHVIDVGVPVLDDYEDIVLFAARDASQTGIVQLQYIGAYATDTYIVDGDTLASGQVMTFTIQDRGIPYTTQGDAWFTAHLSPTGRAVVDCGGNWQASCASSGTRVLGDGDPAPGGRTLQFASDEPFVLTGLEMTYNAYLSSTTGITYAVMLSDTALISLLEEGAPLPGGGSVAAITNVSLLPHASWRASVAAVVDVAGSAPGEQRLLLLERDDAYATGSILNHVILEYGKGIVSLGASPYLANSTFQHNFIGIEHPSVPGSEPAAVGIFGDLASTFYITNCTVSDNEATGISINSDLGGRVVIENSLITNNSISGQSGIGIRIDGGSKAYVVIQDNTVSYNSTSILRGAGILMGGEFTVIEGNSITRNSAFAGGGGMVIDGYGAVRFNTFAGNEDHIGWSATANSGGSAILLDDPEGVVMYNTIVGNDAQPQQEGEPNGVTILVGPYQYQDPMPILRHNNLLGNTASQDLMLSNYQGKRMDADARLNYWGSNNVNVIRYDRIYDYWQDFEPGEAIFQPFLTAPEPLAPAFLLSAATTPPSPIGAEMMTITLDFSTDMNTAVTPTVTFGVDEPYSQHTIASGGWVSTTCWVGTYDVSVDTGDGINTMRVKDAEDINGNPIPEDTRFIFVIQTAGTQAVLLEAAASVGQVDLTWTQNDVTDLAGYILYRSPYTNTDYAPIGGGMFITTTYTDTAVTNGTLYYYRYSVLDTDFNEVAWSNEVGVVPDDHSLPTTPTVIDDGATTNVFTQLHARWSSQDPETGIAEYQYCIGTATDNCDTVSWTSMGALTETTKTGLSLADGQTYYINVQSRNGADHWSAVGSSDGILIDKLAPPVITAVTPITGVRNTFHVITIDGSGFQASPAPTVRLGSTTLGSVSVVNTTQLTAVVPSGIAAGVYTATVTNFDTQVGSLAHAYTATNPSVGPRTFLLSPSTQRVGDGEASTTVDVRIEDVSDLGAFEFKVTFNPSIVHVDDVTLGWFLGSGGRSTSALGPEIDNVAGEVAFGAFSYGSGSGADGSGTLATITFSPQVTGTTDLVLENVTMADTLSYEIPANPQDGEIQVVHYPFGDFDRDCDVDVSDIMVVASRWNDPGSYDAAYDFDSDGDIDVLDIMRVASVWGDTCGVPDIADRDAAWADDTAQEGADILFDPQSATVGVGVPFTMTVAIADASDVGAFEFDLVFDPSAITITDVYLGDFLASSGNNVGELGPRSDSSGHLTFGAFSYGSHAGATGSGDLAVLELVRLADTQTVLQLEDVQLVDSDAGQLAVHSVGEGRIGQLHLYLPLVVRQ